MKLKFLLFTVIILLLITSCQYRYHMVTEEPYGKLYTDKQPNLALVLSGAGSKAIVHAGVIAAFEKNKIPIDLIVGSSAGALVGLLYAEYQNSHDVKNILINAKRSDFLQGSPTRNILSATLFNKAANFRYFNKFLDKNIKTKTFENLKTPLVVVATDVKHNKTKFYNAGPIYPAIISSCAIPGLYQPVKIGDDVLVDGGVISPLPVETALKFNPKITVAVNVISPPTSDEINNNFSMLYRVSWITYYKLSKMEENLATVSLNIDTSKYDWLDDLSVTDKEELFKIGFDSAEKMIKENQKLF
ncbi:MAG: NTE family protein [Candidatus Midichloriaceae bacterium]|jgi:NTE family protein